MWKVRVKKKEFGPPPIYTIFFFTFMWKYMEVEKSKYLSFWYIPQSIFCGHKTVCIQSDFVTME